VEGPGLEAGDIVAIATSYPIAVSLAVAEASRPLLGVISTNPGLLLGATEQPFGQRPVALTGRVPTKVNIEGGEIKVGDKIALSSVPGIGRKATPYDASVGIALESYAGTPEENELIEVFINLERGIDEVGVIDLLLGTTTPDTASTTVSTTETSSATSSAYQFATNFLSRLAQALIDWFASAGNGIADFFAEEIHAKNVYAEKLCLTDETGQTCVTKKELDALLAGAAISVGHGEDNAGTSTPATETEPNEESDTETPAPGEVPEEPPDENTASSTPGEFPPTEKVPQQAEQSPTEESSSTPEEPAPESAPEQITEPTPDSTSSPQAEPTPTESVAPSEPAPEPSPETPLEAPSDSSGEEQ